MSLKGKIITIASVLFCIGLVIGIVLNYSWKDSSSSKIQPAPKFNGTQIAGLNIKVIAVTFHEGFRSKGLKAADVILSLEGSTEEHIGNEGRVIAITGISGKVYETEHMGGLSTSDTKHTITIFRDVDDFEKNIESVTFLDNKTMTKTELPVIGITPTVIHQ